MPAWVRRVPSAAWRLLVRTPLWREAARPRWKSWGWVRACLPSSSPEHLGSVSSVRELKWETLSTNTGARPGTRSPVSQLHQVGGQRRRDKARTGSPRNASRRNGWFHQQPHRHLCRLRCRKGLNCVPSSCAEPWPWDRRMWLHWRQVCTEGSGHSELTGLPWSHSKEALGETHRPHQELRCPASRLRE